VDSELFSAKGYGEVEPVADNKTAEGRTINCRVELNKLARQESCVGKLTNDY